MKTNVIFPMLTAASLLFGSAVIAAPGGRDSSALERGARNAVYDLEISRNRIVLPNPPESLRGGATNLEPNLANLAELMRRLHADVNIMLAPGVENVRVADLKLRASDLQSTLNALQVASGGKFQWTVKDGAIPLFVLSPSPESTGRSVEVFNLRPYFTQLGYGDDPDSTAMSHIEALEHLKHLIITTFNELVPNGSKPQLQYHSGANLLVVIGEPEALDVARKVINALQAPGAQMGYAAPFGAAAPSSPQRRALMAKLSNIRLDEVAFDALPLSEVVRMLAAESKKRDPQKEGINFLIMPRPANAPAAAPAIDPMTGLPIPRPESSKIDDIAVSIQPSLTKVRLIDVLDAITKVAEPPIDYAVTDYAVTFFPRTPDPYGGFGGGYPGMLPGGRR